MQLSRLDIESGVISGSTEKVVNASSVSTWLVGQITSYFDKSIRKSLFCMLTKLMRALRANRSSLTEHGKGGMESFLPQVGFRWR